MPVVRYKNKPITPVDAVLWNGENFEEVLAVCPEAQKPGQGSMLWIPGPEGSKVEVYVGEFVMKLVAGGAYSKLDEDVFVGLYTPQ